MVYSRRGVKMHTVGKAVFGQTSVKMHTVENLEIGLTV